jgi:hypothetical protein
MFYRRNWIAVIVVILGLAMFVSVAQAQRQDFEYILCTAQTGNIAHYSPEVGFWTYDAKGIIQSTHENKLFDNWTSHAVGVTKMVGGKWSWNGLAKRMAPDGEFIIWENYGDSESGSTWKAVYGTGKWKGIKGESKDKAITRGKPILQGTLQVCNKVVGWIELPK